MRRRWFDAAALLLVLFAAVGTVRPVFDLDLHWHLRTGEWILEHRGIPTVDEWSHTYRGHAWKLVDWASEVVLALVHGAGGPDGLIALTVLLAAAAMALAAANVRRGGRHPSAILAVATLLLVYAASAPRFTTRPQTFMMALLGLELWAFRAADDPAHRRRALWVVPLLAVWSNLHGSSFIGVALMGAYCGGQLLAVRHGPTGRRRGDALFWCATGLAALAASFLAPKPLGRLDMVTGLFLSRTMQGGAPEWGPTPLAVVLGPLGALMLMTAAGFAADRRAVRPWEWLVTLLSAWLGLRHYRFIPVFAFMAAPLGYRHMATALERALERRPLRSSVRVVDAVAGALALAGAFGVAFVLDVATPWLGEARRPRGGVMAGAYPEGAVRFLERERPRGHMWNSFRFGGYLLYRLRDVPVFIDGRTFNLYDEAFVRRYLSFDAATWKAYFAEYGVDYVVMERNADAPVLLSDPDWSLVFFDDVADVYVRRGGPNEGLLARLAYRAISPYTPVPAPGAVPPERLAQLAAESERAVAAAPDSTLALNIHAAVRLAAGDTPGVERDLRRLTELAPDLSRPWYRLADLHLRTGDRAHAAAEFQRALSLEPELAETPLAHALGVR